MNPAFRIAQLIDLYQLLGNPAYLVEAKATALCLSEQGCQAYEKPSVAEKGNVGKSILGIA